jgi:hypothetical protein
MFKRNNYLRAVLISNFSRLLSRLRTTMMKSHLERKIARRLQSLKIFQTMMPSLATLAWVLASLLQRYLPQSMPQQLWKLS